jgi:hypothetical protein
LSYQKSYCWNGEKSNGYEACDILVQHYKDDSFRTIVLSKEDFETLQPWKLCSLLNAAYESGKKDAMTDLRRLIGVDK